MVIEAVLIRIAHLGLWGVMDGSWGLGSFAFALVSMLLTHRPPIFSLLRELECMAGVSSRLTQEQRVASRGFLDEWELRSTWFLLWRS
jgi:hypothetical protein